MGNCCSRNKDKKENEDHLIRDKYCDQCQITFLSNYEYNRHIPTCKRLFGDI